MSHSLGHPRASVVALRGLALAAAVGAGGVGLLAVALPPLARLSAGPAWSFVDALEALCAAATVLCWAWLQLGALLVAATAVATACRAPRIAAAAERASGRAVPDALRKVLLVCCGAALSGVGVLPAGAATVRAPDTLPATGVASTLTGTLADTLASQLDGLALPDRQTGLPTEPSRWVTVRAGDSLWAIARRLLPAGADDPQISDAWHRIAAANREVLAAHPDLIHPGTRLRVPIDRRDRL